MIKPDKSVCRAGPVQVGGMWTDALVSMMALEWPAAYEGVTRPNLRTGAENLMAGPHLYPRQTGRGEPCRDWLHTFWCKCPSCAGYAT